MQQSKQADKDQQMKKEKNSGETSAEQQKGNVQGQQGSKGKQQGKDSKNSPSAADRGKKQDKNNDAEESMGSGKRQDDN